MSFRRKVLIVACAVFGVAVLIPIVRHYQLRFAVESYIAQLKAKGEPMELAQVIPLPVPPEKNSAPLITNALSQIYLEADYTNSIILKNPPVEMNQEIPGKEMIGWHQMAVHAPGNYYPTNTWDDLDGGLTEEKIISTISGN
jgi:hypothetical protein